MGYSVLVEVRVGFLLSPRGPEGSNWSSGLMARALAC